jgi:hypothetical protein
MGFRPRSGSLSAPDRRLCAWASISSWGDDVRDDAFRRKLAGKGLAVAAIYVCTIGRLDHDSVREALEVADVTFYA